MKRTILSVFIVALGFAVTSVRAQLPIITNLPACRALWTGGNVTFQAGVSNSGPFVYQWMLNGTNLPNNVISTVAGNGNRGFSGDGGLAKNATLSAPNSVVVDEFGNLFIADRAAYRVREVNTNGLIETVAGNGLGFYSGDGGPATNAGIYAPVGLAIDKRGDLFVADVNERRVRKIGADRIITTVAGNGISSYSGDGAEATNASLGAPTDVAVDAVGNLYVADSGGDAIRKVDTNGIITTVAGQKNAYGYSGDGGLATNATLLHPEAVAVDALGNLFIADSGNFRIRKVDTNGIITTVAGNGLMANFVNGVMATNTSLYGVEGIAVDAFGNLFISDVASNQVYQVDTNGIITLLAGTGSASYSGDGGAATNASLHSPQRISVDACNNLFIADQMNNCIRKVTNTRGSALGLNNVTPANAGHYEVVVTGPDGSVTNDVVNLIVTSVPLIFHTACNPDGSIALNSLSLPDSTNVLFCTKNLLPPVVWQPISTNVAGPDGNWRFTDTGALGHQTRFYRFVTQ